MESWHASPEDVINARPGSPRPYLTPQKGLHAALVRAGHYHTGTVSVFVLLQEKKKVSSTLTQMTRLPSDPTVSPGSPCGPKGSTLLTVLSPRHDTHVTSG